MSELLTMDFDTDTIQVLYTTTLVDTIKGAKGSCGEPEEPDEDIYSYELESVALFGVDLTVHFDMSEMEDEVFHHYVYERLTELMEELV